MFVFSQLKEILAKNVDLLIDETSNFHLEHPSEIELALQLMCFGEVIEDIANSLLPHVLCEYLYNLTSSFHKFYRDCKVQGDEKENDRLILCEVTSRILKRGFNLLGLKTLERM